MKEIKSLEGSGSTYFLRCIEDGYMDGSKEYEDLFCKKGKRYKVNHLAGITKGSYLEFTDELGNTCHGWNLLEDDFEKYFILEDGEEPLVFTAVTEDDLKENKHSHYYKDCPYDKVDVYRVLDLFTVTDPCIQHAAKKLLVTGGRGHKNIDTDVQDVIDTLLRWQEMRKEGL